MSRNVKMKIRIEMVECEEPVNGLSDQPEELGNGEFQLVLDGDKSLDIDALEAGSLNAAYPAMRQTLAEHQFGDDGQPKPQCDSATTKASVSVAEPSESQKEPRPPQKPPKPRLRSSEVLAACNEVLQEMERRDFPAEQITAAQPQFENDSAIDYESPKDTMLSYLPLA